MAQLLQSIILSDITLFLIIGLLMVLISWWAFSIREYAGYILGWMVGFLFSLLISAFFVGQPQPELNADPQTVIGPMVFLGLLVSSIVGLIVGSFTLIFVRSSTAERSRAARAIAVAIATSFTLAAGYLMILSSFSIRLMIAAFVLAVAIGALFNFILTRQRARQSVATLDEPQELRVDVPYTNNMAESVPPEIINSDLPSPLAQRIQKLRQRARRFGE